LHLAAHNGQRDAVGVLWAAYPEAAVLEDGWGLTPIELAWCKGHWEVVDLLESQSGVAPRLATAAGEVVAPYDPSTPQEADLLRQQHAADVNSANGHNKSGAPPQPPADASGLPRPGEVAFMLEEEYAAQQARWQTAAANRPQKLAVEAWIARNPHSFLAKKVAAEPTLPQEWRRQIARHLEWLEAPRQRDAAGAVRA